MSQSYTPLSAEKKRKLVIFGIIPVLLLLLAVFLYTQFSKFSTPGPRAIKNVNVTIPERSKKDTMANNKADVYALLADKQKKDLEGKAVFNANDKLNLGTDIGTRPDSVIKDHPDFQEPAFLHRQSRGYKAYSSANMPFPTLYRGGNDDRADASFNSIIVPHAEERKNADFSAIVKRETGEEINCPAIVDARTKIMDGGSVGLRTMEDITTNGKIIPMGSVLTGTARFNQTRVLVNIASTNIDNRIVFLKLTAYDNDGVEGLRIHGNAALKKGANQTLDDQINAVGEEAQSQLSGLGGQLVDGVVRNIVRTSSNSRKEEMTIPAGYKIILKN